MKVELSDEGWAAIRDPRKLPERYAQIIEDAQLEFMAVPGVMDVIGDDPEKAEGLTDLSPREVIAAVGPAGFRAMRAVKHATVLAYTSEWSYGVVSQDVLLDIAASELNELLEEIGKVIKAIGGARLNVELSADPKAPIEPSAS